jgi:DNA (cytosine-5)-methyltransferase 1
VFVVGCLGDWRAAAEVLFESESLSGDSKPSRKTRKGVAEFVESSFGQYRDHAQATQFKGGGNSRNNDGKGNGLGVGHPGDPMNTLDTSSRHSVAFGWQNSPSQSMSMDTISPTLDKSKTPATMHNMAVRRLTPVECERLQGFPDDYTNIPKAADGNRYKALGNSMAVPVMRWIGERINQYEQRGVEKHL